MEKNNEYLKVLSALSLAASDAREDTLSSVLISTLNDLGSIDKEELNYYIKETFGFDPYEQELSQVIYKLIDENKVESDSAGTLKLTNDEKLRLGQLEISIRDREKARYRNFRSFLEESNHNSFTDSQNRLLWSTFIEYIYNNFFDYGEEALERLHPHIQHHGKFENEEDYFQTAFTKLQDQQLCQLFRFVVDKFPDYASQDDIDFLNDLAQRTLSFASLGIDPKLASTAVDIALVDWVLYLDTNVLYSILGLHSHPENEATKALISLRSCFKTYQSLAPN